MNSYILDLLLPWYAGSTYPFLQLGRFRRYVFSVHLKQSLDVALPGSLTIAPFAHAAADPVVMCQAECVADLVTENVLQIVHRAVSVVTSPVHTDQCRILCDDLFALCIESILQRKLYMHVLCGQKGR